MVCTSWRVHYNFRTNYHDYFLTYVLIYLACHKSQICHKFQALRQRLVFSEKNLFLTNMKACRLIPYFGRVKFAYLHGSGLRLLLILTTCLLILAERWTKKLQLCFSSYCVQIWLTSKLCQTWVSLHRRYLLWVVLIRSLQLNYYFFILFTFIQILTTSYIIKFNKTPSL